MARNTTIRPREEVHENVIRPSLEERTAMDLFYRFNIEFVDRYLNQPRQIIPIEELEVYNSTNEVFGRIVVELMDILNCSMDEALEKLFQERVKYVGDKSLKGKGKGGKTSSRKPNDKNSGNFDIY